MTRLSGIEKFLFYLLIFFLPTQLGKHFWPPFSFLLGLRVDYLSPTLFLTDVFVISIALCVALRKGIKIPFSPQRILFVGFIFLQLTVAKNTLLTAYGYLKLIEMLFLVLYVKNNMQTFTTRYIVLFLTAGVLCQSFLAVAQFFLQASIGGIFYWFGERAFTAQTPGIATVTLNGVSFLRAYATLPHPNVLAGYLSISVLILLHLLKKQRLSLLFMWPVFCIASLAMVLTFSRLTFFLYTATCLILGFSWTTKKKYRLALVGVITFCCLLLYKVGVLSRYWDIFSQQSFLERRDLLLYALALFRQSPIWGVGLYNFLPSLSIAMTQAATLYALQPVHNIYALVAVETGIIGLGALLYVVYRISDVRKKTMNISALTAAFYTLLLIGVVDHYLLTLQQGQLLTALVLGLVLYERHSEKAVKNV